MDMPSMRHTQSFLSHIRDQPENTLKSCSNIGWEFFELSECYVQKLNFPYVHI